MAKRVASKPADANLAPTDQLAPPDEPAAGPAELENGATGKRAEKSAARRSAIVEAALAEFCSRGYADARLDDVARRAGVAKGTIYLHFRDKETLFQEIVGTMLAPMIAAIEAPPPPGVPIRTLVERRVELFIHEIYATHRRDVLRLVMTEGPRFPELAEFYYRAVVERAIAAMRGLLQQAVARGELAHDGLVGYPQLVVAPLLMSIIWSGLFERFAPLDVAAMMRVHLDLLFGKEGAP